MIKQSFLGYNTGIVDAVLKDFLLKVYSRTSMQLIFEKFITKLFFIVDGKQYETQNFSSEIILFELSESFCLLLYIYTLTDWMNGGSFRT